MPKNRYSPKPCVACHNILVFIRVSSWVAAQHSNWRTISHLSLTAYSLQSHLPSLSGGNLLCLQPEDIPWHGDKAYFFICQLVLTWVNQGSYDGLNMQLKWRATRKEYGMNHAIKFPGTECMWYLIWKCGWTQEDIIFIRYCKLSLLKIFTKHKHGLQLNLCSSMLVSNWKEATH
jgi:hypothetical protein